MSQNDGHTHDVHGHDGTDLRAGLMGFFAGLIGIALVVYGISRWTSSLFAGHAG